MAKGTTKRAIKRADGPFLAMALICEKVLEEKSGLLTPVRVIDRMMINLGRGAQWPQPVPVPHHVVIGLKSGAARGSYAISLKLEGPDGQPAAPEMKFPVLFEGEDRGVNLVLQMAFVPKLEGLYWYDVCLDGKLLTRIPLRIVVQQVSIGPQPQSE